MDSIDVFREYLDDAVTQKMYARSLCAYSVKTRIISLITIYEARRLREQARQIRYEYYNDRDQRPLSLNADPCVRPAEQKPSIADLQPESPRLDGLSLELRLDDSTSQADTSDARRLYPQPPAAG